MPGVSGRKSARHLPQRFALSGDDLKQQRLAYDLTQERVAEQMGIGVPRVCRIEQQRIVAATTAKRYLQALRLAAAGVRDQERELARRRQQEAADAAERARAEERDREIQQRHEEWQEEATARAAAQELAGRMPSREPAAPAEATDVYVQGIGYVPVAMLTRARIRPPSSPRRY